jgi:tRNA-dihydrouridine synthase B
MEWINSKFSIGTLKFPRFIGGPLDGITDSPFRKLVRKYSKEELLYSEMRHVACIANDKGAAKALNFDLSERPLAFQVAANDIKFINTAIDKILTKGVDILDLNIGCPARNVVSSGSGSALMADLPRLKNILVEFRKSLNIPFTLKMRAGFKIKNAVDVALLAQDCGVDAIILHPRLQTQHFSGRPDVDLAAQVKKQLQIPLLYSGNVVNWSTAKTVYEATGVDGFLIGRGLWAKPWKLYEINENASGREFKLDQKEILQIALQHLEYMLAYYGEHGLFCFRKHLPFYLRGINGASQLRSKLVTICSSNELKLELNKLQENL